MHATVPMLAPVPMTDDDLRRATPAEVLDAFDKAFTEPVIAPVTYRALLRPMLERALAARSEPRHIRSCTGNDDRCAQDCPCACHAARPMNQARR